jgi:protein-L-isoaspartate(D-aspartate) O-methyltransferase
VRRAVSVEGSQRPRRALIEALTKQGVLRTESVRAALLEVPRDAFIPEVVARHGIRGAYRDEAFPTKTDADGMALSSCSQPGIVAEMLELAEIVPGQRILEIGTGTGYNATLLARLAGRQGSVASIEVEPDTAEEAMRAIDGVGGKVTVAVGDGREGWAKAAPYDRIMATASSYDVPQAWFDQLVDGGVLVMPLRLTEALPFRQVVVALRKDGDHLESVAVVPGGFMRLRAPGDQVSLPWPEIKITSSEGGKRTALVTLSGQPLERLGAASRRRLLHVVLSERRHSPLGLRVAGQQQFAFETFVALAAPEHRLVGFLRPDLQALVIIGTCLPAIIESDGSGLATLGGRSMVGRIDEYGAGSAGDELRTLAGDWRDMGRPELQQLRIGVSVGTDPDGSAWKVSRRGDSRLTFEWIA